MRTLLLMLLTVLPSGGKPDISVVRSGPASVTATVGEAVSTAFRVHNNTGHDRRVRPNIALPTGWRALVVNEELRLEPGTSQLHIATLLIPRSTPPDTYVIRLGVPHEGEAAGTLDSLLVIVPIRHELHLAIDSMPAVARSGASFHGIVHVRNNGNSRVGVRLGITGTGAVSSALDTAFLLAAGQSRSVRVRTTAHATKTGATHGKLIARAIPDANAAGMVVAESNVAIESADRAASWRHTVPGKLRLVSEANGVGLGVIDISASGLLHDGGTTRLDLRARHLTSDYFQLGEREEYLLSLKGKGFHLVGGDQVFVLSPLTGAPRYGFGLSAGVETKTWKLRGFTHYNRYIDSPLQGGVQLGVQPLRSLGFALNYATLAETNRDALTLQSRWTPVRGVAVELEGGQGLRAADNGHAHSARFRADGKSFGLDARHSRATSNYGGNYPGLNADYGHAFLRLSPGVRLSVSGGRSQHDELSGGATIWKHRDERVHGSIELGGASVLEYTNQMWEDSVYNYWSARRGEAVSLRHTFGRSFSITPTIEIGRSGVPGAEALPFKRALLQSSFTFGEQSVAFDLERAEGEVLYAPGARSISSVGAQVSTFIASTVQFGVNARARREERDYRVDYVTLDARLRVHLPGNQEIGLRANVLRLGGGMELNRSLIYLDYSIGFGVPAGNRRNSGNIEGQLLDAEANAAMPGVVMHLSSAQTTTDANGRFRFAGIPAGIHYLQIDRASAGLDRVSTRSLPLQVDLRSGQTLHYDIGMVRSASIAGLVVVRGSDVPVPDALIELSRAGQVHRRVTDELGRFDFSDLVPGAWLLRVVSAALPEHHALESDRLNLDLKPMGRDSVSFYATPKTRGLKVREGGEIKNR